jgi:phosphatidylglycerol:prolipoprotein diacylglycerol transferase
VPTLHDPVAISIFGISIRWYALFILTGIVVSILVIQELARRRGMDAEFVLDVAPWVVFAAIIGARLYYLALKWRYYSDHPEQAINIRLGGLTIHGALAAGIIVFAIFCWRSGQRFLAWADLVIAAVPIGQSIGRWGNWANQEAFGTPTTLPWAVHIDPDRRPPGYEQYSTFHPTFLYEGIIDILIAAILIWIVLRMPGSAKRREGDALWTYFILYGAGRFFIERVRTDSLTIGPWPAAYWVSFGLILLGGTMLVLRHTVWPSRKIPPVESVVSQPRHRPVETDHTLGVS